MGFLAAGLAGSHAHAVTVLAEGTGSNGNTYVVVALPEANWAEAEADLASDFEGFHLATLTSADENDFVASLLAKSAESGLFGDFWFGAYQTAPKPEIDPAADWRWVTDEAWDFTNWYFGEPNDAGGIEDHASMMSGGFWNDEGTAIGLIAGYIAESSTIPVAPVPLPPMLPAFVLGLAALGVLKRRR
jgi:hypothetical protein